MTKPNSYYREIKDAQQYNFDDKIMSICPFNFEWECFESSNYIADREEKKSEKGEDNILIFYLSIFVGILVLSFVINTPIISKNLEGLTNHSADRVMAEWLGR